MAAATLTLMVLTLTGQVVALRSDKPFVSAQDSARIELRVLDDAGRPLRDAHVSLTVNVGTVTEPTPTQEGVFIATYQPPTQEGPQVALFHAAVKRGAVAGPGAWLSLPIHGRHHLRVQAPPRSRVQVSIGGASFGPVIANASGEATLPVEVPPGASSALVTTVSRSGRTRTQTVPLPASRFTRIRLVAPETPRQATPVRLQGFVVDESGNPAVPLPPIAVSTDRGTLGPVEPKEGGVFEVSYTAPARSEAPVSLSAYPLEDPERTFTFQFEPGPAPLTQPAGRSSLEVPPGSPPVSGMPPTSPRRSPWQPSVGVLLFAQSNTAFSNGIGARLEGSLRLAELPWEALLLLEGRLNQKETQHFPPEKEGSVNKTFTLRGFGARLGGRWSRPFLTRGLVFADASAGLLRMSGSVRLEGPRGAFEQSLRSMGPALSMGGGLGWALGRGRLYGQLHWAYAPGQERVRGNLGGLSVGLGYQLPLTGDEGP
jgi:hypothetical protein